MAKVAKESMDLCTRVDLLLEKATNDQSNFYEFATENYKIVKYAFLARAVVKGLINPLPELFTSIAVIEKEFSEYASQVDDVDNDDNDEDE
jgi:hypothetical protein